MPYDPDWHRLWGFGAIGADRRTSVCKIARPVPPLDCAEATPTAAPRGAPSAAIVFAGVSVEGWDGRAGMARELLRDVDWRVERGEHWAILGPIGAGKTTVLLTARRRLHPSRGAI